MTDKVLLEKGSEIKARLKHYFQKSFRQPCVRHQGFKNISINCYKTLTEKKMRYCKSSLLYSCSMIQCSNLEEKV